jgi:integrase
MARREFGSVRQRTDGRWEARISVAGQRSSYYAATKAAAQALLRDLYEQDITGRLSQPSAMTLSDFLALWLGQVTLRPKTEKDYRHLITKYVLPVLGSIKLHQLKPLHLAHVTGQLSKSGKLATAEKLHKTLKRALKHGVSLGLLAQNPADRLKTPKTESRAKPIWTNDQLHVFLESLESNDSRWRHLWVFLLSSGLRIGEALALEWSDLEGNKLTIGKSLTRFKADEVVVGVPKTRAGNRTITLPQQAVLALGEWRDCASVAQLHYGWSTNRIFSTEQGTVPNLSILRRTLRTACKHADVPYPTIHGLRHIHSSLLIANGVDIKALQTRLGHANAAVTMKIYAHLMANDDQVVADLVQNALSPRLQGS